MDKEEIREIYKEDIDEVVFDQMSKYMDMTKEELSRIRPIWAVGDQIDELENRAFHPNVGLFRLAKVKLSALLKITQPTELDITNLFTGDLNDYRYATTLMRWEEGLSVDPPTISLSQNNLSRVTISDGRHRTYLSNFLGELYIPIAIRTDFYDEINDIIELSSPYS